MQSSRVHLTHTISTLVLAVTFCLQLPPPVQADDIKPFEAETATVDSSPTVDPNPPQPQTSTVLEGSVRKRGALSGPDGSVPPNDSVPNLNASDSATTLQSEAAAQDDQQRFQLAASKLASGAKLTAEDYRNLQIGTCGWFYRQWSFERHAKVVAVYAGSPAEQAGILKGDVILSDSSAPKTDWSDPSTTWIFGHAGTQVTVKILRNKQVLSFTLTRMNIEDIQDPKARLKYEQLAKKLGPTGEGVVKN